MNRKHIVAALMLTLIMIGVGTAFVQPQEAHALEAFIHKVKSDCASIQLGITLVHRNDDNAGGEDWFRMIVYEREAWVYPSTYLAQVDERITGSQSPFYWLTHRIETVTHRGRYTIEIWDLDKNGNPVEMLDQVHHECGTGVSWRGNQVQGPGAIHTLNPAPNSENRRELPYPNCSVLVPFYTTNTAPEPGVIVFTWSDQPQRDVDNPREWHAMTLTVGTGDYFVGGIMQGFNHIFSMPCGVYINAYFIPDSTKLQYLMPSQYWPNTSYGTGVIPSEAQAPYYTVFPLNGAQRSDPDAPPTSTPRPATATPIPSPTPSATP